MYPRSKDLKRILLFPVGVLVLGAGIWLVYYAAHPVGEAGKPSAIEGQASSQGPRQAVVGSSAASRAPQPQPPAPAVDFVGALVARLDPQQPDVNREQLAQLHAQLGTLARDEAARQLVVFLDSGTDANTGMRLRVGKGGWLEAASTLRVAALDWLAEFDPTAAFEYAQRIFATSSSGDEWAVALRNYRRSAPPDDPFFVARVKDIFSNVSWLQNPSGGVVESVDFPVAIGGPEGFSILNSVLATTPFLRRPTLAALDAWVIQDRRLAIPFLVDATSALAKPLDEFSRAALLSRADLRDETQRAAIQRYLASADIPADAKEAFLRQFPNQNMFLGDHLVTHSQPMPLTEIVQLDTVALDFIDQLIRTRRHPELSTELAAARERLLSYAGSAQRGGKK